ncbi:hypothetical protein QBC35DRAFT_371424, partial [Podospora australis]
LPLGLLNAAQGHPISVELKNGETLNGHLVLCDTWMNLTLREVVQTSPEGDKFVRLPEAYVKGNNIKYLRVPDEIIDNVKEQQQSGGGYRGGRGGGNGGRGGGDRGRGGRAGRACPKSSNPIWVCPPSTIKNQGHHMPIVSQTPRLVVDGLWRCLCPSIDALFLSRTVAIASQLPENGLIASTRQRQNGHQSRSFGFQPRGAASLRQQCRSNASLATARKHLQDVAIPTQTFTATARGLVKGTDADYDHKKLDHASNEVIFEALRKLCYRLDKGAKIDTGARIREFVRYLVEERDVRPNVLLYEALVMANADTQAGSSWEVDDILREMNAADVAPSHDFFHAALKTLAVHPDYLTRNSVLRKMELQGVELTVNDRVNVALGLLREEQNELALDWLEGMMDDKKEKIIKVWDWVLDIFQFVLAKRGFVPEAFQIMVVVKKSSSKMKGVDGVSLHIWSFMLEECSRELDLVGTKFIWDRVVQSALIAPSDGVIMNVLNTASRHGESTLATQALQQLVSRGIKLSAVHYEALLDCYTQVEDLERAFEVLCIMSGAGIQPDQAATRSIYMLLHRRPELAVKTVDILIQLKRRHEIPFAALNVLLEFVAVKGNMKMTLDIFLQIRHLCPRGQHHQIFRFLLQQTKTAMDAEFIAKQMERYAVKATPQMLDDLIRCYASDGDIEVAFNYVGELGTIVKTGQSAKYPSTDTLLGLLERCYWEKDPRAWHVLEETKRRNVVVDPAAMETLDAIPKPKEILPVLSLGTTQRAPATKRGSASAASRAAARARAATTFSKSTRLGGF